MSPGRGLYYLMIWDFRMFKITDISDLGSGLVVESFSLMSWLKIWGNVDKFSSYVKILTVLVSMRHRRKYIGIRNSR